MFKLGKIYRIDARKGLSKLPDESIDCVVTSPPYWFMRDYGNSTDSIWGGKKNCKHDWENEAKLKKGGGTNTALYSHHKKGTGHISKTSQFCTKCRAWKGQLGLEPSISMYIEHLCDIFDDIKRVLTNTGTVWVNIGDTYFGSYGSVEGDGSRRRGTDPTIVTKGGVEVRVSISTSSSNQPMRRKSLCQIPSRFAIEMANRGWILRNSIVWRKPGFLPTSAKDRFGNSWEYFFLFTKSPRYFFDLDSVRELHMHSGKRRNPKGKNPGDCWNIAKHPHSHGHPAAFPQELCVRPILAGCPKFVCTECEKPKIADEVVSLSVSSIADSKVRKTPPEREKAKSIWCDCNGSARRGVVLDPFAGSGTMAVIAEKLGRSFLGFDLNPSYVRTANHRLKEHDVDGGKSVSKRKSPDREETTTRQNG